MSLSYIKPPPPMFPQLFIVAKVVKYLRSLLCCVLRAFVLLSGSELGCLHSAAGEAPCCLDKRPNTESEGCPIVHLPRRVCAITALNVLCLTRFRMSMKQSKLQFFIHKLTGVFPADVHMRPTALFFASRRDSWKGKDVFCVLFQWCHSVRPYQLPCLSVFLQEEKGISCGLVDLDFLKCSVGFPFMRAQTKVAHPDGHKRTDFTPACSVALLPMRWNLFLSETSTFFSPQYHFAVIFDTTQLSGENDTLQFLVQAKR